MGLDSKNAMTISVAMRVAAKFYDEKTFQHCMRVAKYVSENSSIPQDYIDECVCLGILHDLYEDTECKRIPCGDNFEKALQLLTKPKDMNYIDYCKRLRPTSGTHYENCAYWVKLADMKDHLCLKETLTDRLKEKYLAGMAELL